ncbi:hypothetical protein Q8W71_17770 [Methylobacterium sp. NEAU 140]|uniref:hypothetical protein n=1 Tax=Methylobacterium sp. NEAU 140 TaxID=3064945 RepID=UPI0027356C43|nr:hypothetical protein [Methylobacterium sp. NEAU 140]MDP4024477.1 hypothetical protein [Methylobacterium sp. NEAU 140]
MPPPESPLPKRPLPERPLPESLTRHLSAPRAAIWPTPDDRNRITTGAPRPRWPSRAYGGVWLWALAYNLVGFAILFLLWASMGG